MTGRIIIARIFVIVGAVAVRSAHALTFIYAAGAIGHVVLVARGVAFRTCPATVRVLLAKGLVYMELVARRLALPVNRTTKVILIGAGTSRELKLAAFITERASPNALFVGPACHFTCVASRTSSTALLAHRVKVAEWLGFAFRRVDALAAGPAHIGAHLTGSNRSTRDNIESLALRGAACAKPYAVTRLNTGRRA